MNRDQLNLIADKIESVIAYHGVSAKVFGGKLCKDGTVHFLFKGVTSERKLKSLGEEIALAVGVSSARFTRTDNALAVVLPRGELEGKARKSAARRVSPARARRSHHAHVKSESAHLSWVVFLVYLIVIGVPDGIAFLAAYKSLNAATMVLFIGGMTVVLFIVATATVVAVRQNWGKESLDAR
jgi:hypothetical protein